MPKGYHAANVCGCHPARNRQRPFSARAHTRHGARGWGGLETEANRTVPATRYAPRQPGDGTGRDTDEARCFRDGAVESATTQRGPVRRPSLRPPAAMPPPALPRSRAARNGSSAQGACERGGGSEEETRTEQSRGYLLVLVDDVGGEAPCRGPCRRQ